MFNRCFQRLSALIALITLISTSVASPDAERDCLAPPLFAEFTFKTTRDYGYDPNLVIDDFNLDGYPDAAWLTGPFDLSGPLDYYTGTSITIATSCAHGRFTEYAVIDGIEANELVSGDFNADGWADIAAGEFGIKVFLNDQEGGFTESHSLLPGLSIGVLGAEDLDGDGDTDLCSNRGILRNDWPDFVNPQPDLPYDLNERLAQNDIPFEFADLTGNGRLDVIFSTTLAVTDSELVILDWQDLPDTEKYYQVADLNHDTIPELISVMYPGVHVWNIGYTPHAPLDLIETDWAEQSDANDYYNGFFIFDIDQDGHRDIVGSYNVLLRPTNPVSVEFDLYQSSSWKANQTGRVFEFVDVNGDGTRDIVKPNKVSLGRPDPSLLPVFRESPVPGAIRNLSAHVYSGDLNSDGLDDLFVHGRDGIQVFTTDHSRPFIQLLASDLTATENYNGAWIHRATDLNLDGHIDIVVGTASGYLWADLNNGDATFTPTAYPTEAGRAGIITIDVGDLDGDGDEDVVAIKNDFDDEDDPDDVPQNELLVFTNTNGTLEITSRVPFPNENFVISMLLTDLDADGDLDVLATDRLPNETPGLIVFSQNDLGQFELGTRLDLTRPAYWIIEADTDQDGKNEFVVSLESTASGDNAQIIEIDRAPDGSILPGNTRVLVQTALFRVNEIVVRDLDQDGLNDLVTADYAIGYSSTSSTYTQSSDHSFSINSSFGTIYSGGGVASIALLDLNGDSRLDNVVMGRYYQLHFELQAPNPYTACRADYDLDGFLTINDLSTFVLYFLEMHPAADINRDTIVDLSDIQDFVQRFITGC